MMNNHSIETVQESIFNRDKFLQAIVAYTTENNSRTLALRVGVDPAMITRYARGDSIPRADTLGIIASVIGVPVSEFYTEADELVPA